VLRDGQNVGTVPGDETTREELAELMVGREVILEVEKRPATTGDNTLGVDGLVAEDERGVRAVDDVSFEVRSGEVFGIAGVDGNGQSELVEAITGLRDPRSGRISLEGRDITDRSRRERIDHGMAYIPEDRQERGLVMDFDLVGNGMLGSQHRAPFARSGRLDWSTAREHAESVISEYDVRPPNPDATAESLSGGNQQKFIVGREFERDPTLVVAAHPTRGVDVGSIEFIHERLLDLRDRGVAVLLISSKLEEVQGLSDRLAVMHDGSFMDTVDPESVTEEEIGLLMGGEYPDGWDARGDDSETPSADVRTDGDDG
jgi:simple sugar transport system ATP-binding protein